MIYRKRVLLILLLVLCLVLGSTSGAATTEGRQPASDQEWIDILFGTWHASEPMGRGYGRRAMFGEDICYLLPDEEESRGDAFQGNYWTVTDGALEIRNSEGDYEYFLILPLTWATPDNDWDDRADEVMFGDTVMFKYTEKMDPDINVDAYTIRLFFDEMDWDIREEITVLEE